MMGFIGYIVFNFNIFNFVDCIIVLRINIDEMQIEIFFNEDIKVVENLMCQMSGISGKVVILLLKFISLEKLKSNISVLSFV